ncbi:type IV pilin protein [Pseudomonas sp. J452]|nr:type IV pilin protein [Pseudomonas sp. J452]
MRRATCEDAKATLIGAANVMERFRAQNSSYENAALGSYAASPVDGNNKQFTIALLNADCAAAHTQATSYCLVATPNVNSRLDGRGTLTLSSAGVRDGTDELANAWGSCSGI